jgi:heme-degrading monooxygenase HmoA
VHIVVWEFRVRAEAEQAFLAGYGSDGSWVQLFRCAAGYLGTQLTRSTSDSRVFFTLDCWESKDSCDAFRAAFQAEYRALDESFSGLTEQERFVGVMDAPADAS